LSVAAYTSAVRPPLERYDFRTCNENSFSEIVYKDLPFKYGAASLSSLTVNASSIGNIYSSGPTDFTCTPEKGSKAISSLRTKKYMMESNATIGAFQQKFSEVGSFSIAIWLIPGYDFMGDARPFMTIGETQYNPYVQQQCQGFDFRLLQSGSFLYATFTDSLTYCEQAFLQLVPLKRELTHLVFTFGNTSFQVYNNGHPAYPEGLLYKTIDVRNWNRGGGNTLQFFANHQDDATFQGDLIQVDLFNRTLSELEVGALFTHGVGNMADLVEEVDVGKNGTDAADDDDSNNDDGTKSVFRLVAKEPEPIVLPQNSTPQRINLVGYNKSTDILKLAVQVTKLPSHGILYATDNTKIALDQVFSLALGAAGINVTYALNNDQYFNTPKFNAHGMDLHMSAETFEFRTVSFHPLSTDINLVSETIVVPVYVTHINHGLPTATIPTVATLNPKDPSKAFVPGITVTDHQLDFNIDRLRVDVWIEDGMVTLNPLYVHLADFASCLDRPIFGGWQCYGDGTYDRRMTFYAIPEDLTLILNNMVFESFYPRSRGGEIAIRIYDGVDEQCPRAKELLTYYPYNESTAENPIYLTEHFSQCFLTAATVRVPAYGEAPVTPSEGSDTSGGSTSGGTPSGSSGNSGESNSNAGNEGNIVAGNGSGSGTSVTGGNGVRGNNRGGSTSGTGGPNNGGTGSSSGRAKGAGVIVNRGGTEDDGKLYILGFEWREFLFGATSVIITLFCVCGWCRCCKMPRCLTRSSKVVVLKMPTASANDCDTSTDEPNEGDTSTDQPNEGEAV
jgi:Concanavalin A-like lectin/glucanases superfamily